MAGAVSIGPNFFPPVNQERNRSRYKYTTGVVYNVSIWLNSNPPTMAIPSGRRNSAPFPAPTAMGMPPNMRSHGSHQDGPKAQKACLVNGLIRTIAFLALGLQRKINHQNRVFLDDADQQNDADQRNDAQLGMKKQQSQ